VGTRVGVGMSHHHNPKQAGKEAVEHAMKSGDIRTPDFVFMFASVGYNQEVLIDTVNRASGGAPLSGCSGEGIISQGDADESNFSVATMVIQSDELVFANTFATGLKQNSGLCGEKIARDLTASINDETIGMFVFADGLTFNFDRFRDGLEENLKLDRFIPMFGGASGDNWEMKRTYQYCNSRVLSDGAVCTLMSGNAHVAWVVSHGCVPIGAEHEITRCEGNTIYEIDSMPVLEVFKDYLDEGEIDNWSRAVVNLCLGFRAPATMEDYDEYLIRFMPTKDDQKGCITISTEAENGTRFSMTRRDQEKIADGVRSAAYRIIKAIGNQPIKMVFHFDCAGRGKVVFRDQQKKLLLKELQEKVGGSIPWIGFYTYGEIGPVGKQNHFHNYTAIISAVY
jgi:hypothetical protein